MKPILFSSDSTSWESFGVGVLSDAIECIAEENRNGAYELELEYPITGNLFSEIALRRIVVAKPNYTDNPQPFRIYEISKPINGIVTIRAQHISYDLSGYVDAPFTAVGSQAALAQMCDSDTVYPVNMPFTFETDISSSKTMDVKKPTSVRALFGGIEGSLLDTYGGEWHFDGYNCSLKAARGANRGVVIRYGKNLTDLRQEENNAAVYTGVYPYYYNQETEVLVTLPERVVTVPGTFDYTKILPLDLSADFETAPTEAQLRTATESYIETNSVGTPKINITISFVESDTLSDRVDLCDTVSVVFDALGVSATAKCIRTRWDVLKERYIEAELGSARNSLAGTIAKTPEIQQAIEDHSNQFIDISRAIASKVTGNSGGNIILNDTNGDGEPDEILIMDTDNIATAVRIIRINNGGIAFSHDGYNGTYRTAWNIDGEFVADFIASGEINAELVKIIGDTNFSWDAANITIVNPSDSNKMIRFGKYDGTNYGLGFSVDGGTTWTSGFNFNGITFMGGVGSGAAKAAVGNGYFYIDDGTGLTITRVGYGNCTNNSGNAAWLPYFQLGSSTGKDADGHSYTWAQAHGAYSFNAGYLSLPRGAYSVCMGYRNESHGAYSGAIGAYNVVKSATAYAFGRDNTVSATGAVALGVNNEASGMYAVAMGANNKASAQFAFAFGDGLQVYQGSSFACGVYNIGGNYIFEVGNGSSDSNRADALYLDYYGNLWISGSLTQGSDARQKDIIGDVPDVSSVRAVKFKWNDNKHHHDDIEHIGYIAQDVEKVAPYLVQDNGQYKTLDYIGLLCAKIESLERTVEALQSRIEQLEGAR